MVTPEPWVYVPLELIKHAEEHLQANGDFDRRMALIGYDNAIEVSIRTYLQLHPTQRGGAAYQKEQVNQWLKDYHTLLDFFFGEFMKTSGKTPVIARQKFIYSHNLRNNLYHEGKNFVPPERDVQDARIAALYIFSTLFNVNGEELLKGVPLLHKWITKKFNFQGSGNDAFKVPLKVGPAIFRIMYEGQTSHSSDLLDENGKPIANLISDTASLYQIIQKVPLMKYSMTTNIKREGIYILRVSAHSGTWQIEVEQ